MWGKPAGGLQVGLRCASPETPANEQPLFEIHLQNVSGRLLRVPAPGALTRKRHPRIEEFYGRTLYPLLIRQVGGRAAESRPGTGRDPRSVSVGVVALKPGETKVFGGISLQAETFRGGDRTQCENKFLMPKSSYSIAFAFENEQGRVRGQKVWVGRADTGEVPVKVLPPRLEGVDVEGVFELPKGKYYIGEPISIIFKVKNSGAGAIWFRLGGDVSAAGRHARFSIEALEEAGKPAADPTENLPFRPADRVREAQGTAFLLKPGETYAERVLLNNWCMLNKPGKYTITCRRGLLIAKDPEQAGGWPEAILPTLPVETKFPCEIVAGEKAQRDRIRRLVALLASKNEETAGLAQQELGVLAMNRSEVAFRVFERMARGRGPFQRQAVNWVACYGTAKASPVLRDALRSRDAWVRIDSLRLLARLGAEGAGKLVRTGLGSPDLNERRSAVTLCGTYGYSECVGPLLVLSNDLDVGVRRNVAGALGSYEDKRALGPLMWLLNDKSGDRWIKVNAAESLGKHGRDDGVPVVIEMLKDKMEWRDRRRVANALKNITGEDFGGNYEKWNEWWQENSE